MRIQCPCGQVLATPPNAAGKQVRCPKCQTLLQVPAQEVFQQPVGNTFEHIDSSPLGPPPSYAPTYQRKSHPSSSKGLIIVGIVGTIFLGMVGVIGLAVWIFINTLGDFGDAIEADFEPLAQASPNAEFTEPVPSAASPASSTGPKSQVADQTTPKNQLHPAGRNANESAMIAVANTFISHARKNEHQQAVAMIDTKLFHSRLYSAKGSYEAMTEDIPAGKLLKNFGEYALDGAEVGGRRHWDIIGVSQYDGYPGVVLRYYVEPKSPLNALLEPALFNRMAAMVTYDEVSRTASNLLSNEAENTSHYDRSNLSGHAIRSSFPSRAGYMMLVFDCQESTPRLVDLVNVLGQSPLSRTGALVFLDDYHSIGGFGSRETYGTKACEISVYGVSNKSSGGTWDSNDPNSKAKLDKKLAEEAEAVEQARPKRLEKLVSMWETGDAKIASELDRFRKDFPKDLGFELAIVLNEMSSKEPKFSAAQDTQITSAARALYEQWKDPFFLYVEALSASQNGRQSEADALIGRCLAAGFATTQMHIAMIQKAVDQTDTSGIMSALTQWNKAWAREGVQQNSEKLNLLAKRFAEHEKSLNPDPTIGEIMSGGLAGPTGRGRFPGNRRNGPEGPQGPPFGTNGTPENNPPFGGNPDPGGRPAMPGNPGGNPGGFPGFGGPMGPPGFNPGAPPQLSGPQVVIKISSKEGFDGNAITKAFVEKLGIKGYHFSQSNQTATMNLSYEGTLESVVQAIDFGTVEKTDDATKTITVTIP